MIKTRIIPILLLKGNSVVKTVKFQETRIVGDAITNAKVFSSRMADEMIIVDIEATAQNRINEQLFKRLAAECIMPLALGGGVQKMTDADVLFRSGADKIVINSAFYSDPTLLQRIASKYGSQAIIFSLDVRKHLEKYKCISHSGLKEYDFQPEEIAQKAISMGAGELLVNAVDNDGTMDGFDYELITRIAQVVDVPIIAAGGCGSKKDCLSVIEAGASAVAAGSIFYWIGESVITIKKYMRNHGIEVRIT